MISMPFSQTSQPRPQAPERRGLPVVLDEAHVVHQRIEAERARGCRGTAPGCRQRRGFDHHLELVVVLQAERVLAVAAVGRAARGLHVGGAPGLRADRAQEGRGVEGAGADLHVVGLQDHAALLRPVALQREDQILEGARRRGADFQSCAARASASARVYARLAIGPARIALRARCRPCRAPRLHVAHPAGHQRRPAYDSWCTKAVQ